MESKDSLHLQVVMIFLIERGLTEEFSEWIAEQKVEGCDRLSVIMHELSKME